MAAHRAPVRATDTPMRPTTSSHARGRQADASSERPLFPGREQRAVESALQQGNRAQVGVADASKDGLHRGVRQARVPSHRPDAPRTDCVLQSRREDLGVASLDRPSQLGLWPSASNDVLTRVRGLSSSHVNTVPQHLRPELAALVAVVYATQVDGRKLTPEMAVDLVVDGLPDAGYTAQSVIALERNIRRLGSYLSHACSVEDLRDVDTGHVTSWVRAPRANGQTPSLATSHARLHATKVLFATLLQLRLIDRNPVAGINLPARTATSVRPLTDTEMTRAELASADTLLATRQPACLALAQATAVTSEIGRVRVEHLDLDRGCVELSGSKATTPRRAKLTEWGRTQLALRAEVLDHDPSAQVAYHGAGSPASMQASCATALRSILDRAQLSGPDIGPASVRAWAGRRAYEHRGRIEDAALALGTPSLDTAARIIGHHWMAGQ